MNSDFKLLNKEQKRNLLLLAIILLMAFVIYYMTSGSYKGFAQLSTKNISFMADGVRKNTDFYDMLADFSSEYKPQDILAGANPKYLKRYFYAGSKTLAPVVQTDNNVFPNIVNFIYKSVKGSYAVVDNKLVKVGDLVPSGLKVKKIENNRVLLEGERREEWVTLKF